MSEEIVHEFARASRGFVVAPAGCGKTELIAAAVNEGGDGRALVLTHTHAGVHALRRRMKRKGISANRYHLETIAGWALRLVASFPARSGVQETRPRTSTQWRAVYGGARFALEVPAIARVLDRSYSCMYVDEYQDCGPEQHDLVLAIANRLPCRIVGDPLQGIFGFGGQEIVDWGTHVHDNFDALGELKEPWRWAEANSDLGAWTVEIRDALERGLAIDLRAGPVNWRPKARPDQLAACRAALPLRDSTVVAIDSIAARCHRWAQQVPGFSSDEEMEAKDLFNAARDFDRLTGPALAAASIEFAKKCHTGVGTELSTALKAFKDGRMPRIRENTKNADAVKALTQLATGGDRHALHRALDQLDHLPGCRIYRPEVWHEMRSAARFFGGGEAESMEDAAWRMRDRTRRRGKKLPRAVVSRTLLVKGMEFDHGLILDADQLADRENFYVAATRASHSLTIFSDNPVISFGGD